jgi:hypothetical protein
VSRERKVHSLALAAIHAHEAHAVLQVRLLPLRKTILIAALAQRVLVAVAL